MSEITLNGLSILGGKAKPCDDPNEALLERIPSQNKNLNYVVRFTIPEFTSLCPVTSQPDFAHMILDYIPKDWLIESKSLKLFMASFRNHHSFHEDCTIYIARRLVTILDPKWLRIGAYWYPRGGIPIDIFWQTSAPPEGVFLPNQDVPQYRGRG
ncbi:preQ(1) synthase [Candidatus Liberibacter asiaticus]|uniref:NADPH-dependent 7-cyano-7-deazaguanine reductase n=2 Tax=Liberibacter asiaticus TaxID=34021 RepID=C6XHS4_LIBAP|nr:preQ(1) synthase [Candidatus Liberibacter asiaticus]ACT56817.1 7-cyano-7-deazaguanine reductase [Candidatus Liberibacter asiaticus str. psy62]AGH16584.1 7-cyano-7-deazaguanine reductase [Candidatus Liberibacter asiaticus str. gxpsy]ALK06975.1 NADPH-dependent 7-cyano-7-deazaguanine reductase QueF [Candidatus Liberibacter asiaticus]ASK52445.1 NADPH-dependent 7-cyano-7-deazaguanine reductase QueF [Candidatus Liberibacter asiaticus]AWL13772.1 NADPH-dependent 7-cyano-7-deazaguanine reductase Que